MYNPGVTASRWSLERVVNELRQLHAGGEIVSYAGLRTAGFGNLVSAAERYVGSFSQAVKLAGIEPVRPLWTRDRLLAEIKRLHREGVALSSERLAKSGHAGLVHAARRHFGSWPGAVAAAGAPRFKRGRWQTWAQVRDRLQELHRKGARMTIAALEAAGHGDLVAAARLQAGAWNQALKKARIPAVQEHRTWTAAQVLDEIRKLHRAGVALNANLVIARGGRKLTKAATHYFGSWQEACRAAVPSYRPLIARWTVERLLGEIRARHMARLPVRSTDVEKQAPTLTAAARRLGIPWPEACRRAGVPRQSITPRRSTTRTRWDDRRVFAEFARARRAGRPLLTRSFPGGFVGAVLRLFGSWRSAMKAAGLGRHYERDHAAAVANRLQGKIRPTRFAPD